MVNYDKEGEILMLVYGDEQRGRGALLLKNPEGTKLWNNRDIRKSVKDGFIKGYDFDQKLVFMRSDCVKSMYLMPKKEFEDSVESDDVPEEQIAEPNVMFG